VYASYLLFLDYNNPYLPAPKLIKIENVEKKLTYVVTPIKCINKFNPNNIEIPENEYNIYKNNNIIYLTLPSFENPTFKNLKALLPANKIVIDLRYNYGGDLKHVLNFFNIVYNLKIKWGICVKNSN
jgi:C-terminal processing protease CtpA/Prc